MNFPLDLRFKLIAISSQITVRDSAGQVRFSVKQKAFRLKEAVTVYADEAQTTPLYRIGADRIIDFNAQYAIEDMAGRQLGVIKRQGMRSLWRSRYDVTRDGRPVFAIQEANPWVSVADGLFGEIPILGILSGYVFHPAYRVTRVDTGAEAFRVTKEPAFFEGHFRIDAPDSPGGDTEQLAIMSILMMILLERVKG
jgi:hypothetical protein